MPTYTENHGTAILADRRYQRYDRKLLKASLIILSVSFVIMGFCMAYASALGFTSFF